ncbi:MAG TPA: DNA mismatch repair endonuclease MutL [Ktedonobacterales bacterium]|jgi:DNA mismatch repair protein MutL|nr:DNA mismatch repair endonuclease MutL [Ktedonobacterales bacterium]
MTVSHIQPIAALPREVVERIAAGEVIERPASVVRELIENALDAGATSVRVELREGGLGLIRVTDDGWGIPAEALELACQPHTTSKIAALADLDAIGSLGFRGEALASVCAVAEVEITSATDESGLAATITLAEGHVTAQGHTARSRGVTVTARALFAASPARLALLRGPRTETAQAFAVVRAYALIHPAVRFTFVADGALVFSTPGTMLAEAAQAIYGATIARTLLTIEDRPIGEGARLSGAIASRATHFANREHVTLAVNGRPVTNRALLSGLESGYRPLLRKGRHPLAVVALQVPAGALDATVHPMKATVLLRREREISAALREAIHETLGQAPLSVGQTIHDGASVYMARPVQLTLPKGRARWPGLRRTAPGTSADATDEAPEKTLPDLTPLAQFGNALILAQSPQDSLYLVDQHRAHERILYERLMQQRAALTDKTPEGAESATGQALLEPLLIELTSSQAAILAPRLPELRALGLDCQPFGGSAFLIRAVPHLTGASASPASFAEALAQEAAEEGDDWLGAVCVSLACRCAIRRGEELSLAQQRELLADLRGVSASSVCPHGSPLLLRYTQSALAHAFEW